MRESKVLKCVNTIAPSDTYINGISIVFNDENYIEYYTDYPNFKKVPYDFEEGEMYKITFSSKRVNSAFTDKYSVKITRLRNIIKIK